jgi:hypothetical protein
MILKRLYDDILKIAAFLVICLIIQLMLGEKILTGFLYLVLVSQLLINITKIENLVKGIWK